jgi:hypothetical protein
MDNNPRWVRAILIALVVIVVLGLIFSSMRLYR